MIIVNNNYKIAAQAIKESDAIYITAGAGMGVDSGLPDFRGKEGFWRAYPKIKDLKLSFEEMANPQWFKREPELAWAFYGHRLNLYRTIVPHAGFSLLLHIAKNKPFGYFVYTSNVDGHFQKAGFDNSKIVECHGSINHFQCTVPCSDRIWEANSGIINIDESTFRATGKLPVCPDCGKTARPNILMFGDWLWNSKRTDNQENNEESWLSAVNSPKIKMVVIELGAGKAVSTVRNRSEKIASFFNAKLIRINPRDYDGPHYTISINTGAKEGIENIAKYL